MSIQSKRLWNKRWYTLLGNISKDFTINKIKKTGLKGVVFVVLLSNSSNHTECISLSNQECMIQPTLINLQANECSQESHYYPFAVKLDRCVGSCSTLNDL